MAEVPQIDHGVSERFERVVQMTDAFEAKQQAFKFILPSEHSLDGIEAFFKNRSIEEWFSPTLVRFSSTRILVQLIAGLRSLLGPVGAKLQFDDI